VGLSHEHSAVTEAPISRQMQSAPHSKAPDFFISAEGARLLRISCSKEKSSRKSSLYKRRANMERQMAKLTEEQRKVLADSVDEVTREVERANRAFEALGVDTQLSAVLTDRTGRPVADDVLAELSPEQRARLLAAAPG
jgi:hypothetical protein